MTGKSIKLKQLQGTYAISRLAPDTAIPEWVDGDGFVCIARTEDELSIVCLESRVPADCQIDRDWTCFKFIGPFAFGETGIVLSVIKPLSEAKLGIFVVSTFDGDHLLLKTADVSAALRILHDAGHQVQ